MKKGIIIGIIGLFIVSAVSPMVIGFEEDAVSDIALTKRDDVDWRSRFQHIGQNFRYSKNEEGDFESNYQPKQLIIKFKEEQEVSISLSSDNYVTTGISSIDVLNEKYQVISAEKIFEEFSISALSSIYKFIFSDDVDIYRMVKEYCLDSSVEYAEPNYIYYLSPISYSIENKQYRLASASSNSIGSVVIPDDPYFDEQWALNQSNDCDIDAPEAWQIETGNSDTVIAVIDSGIDYNHPDLSGNIWTNADEIPDNGVDDDNNGFIDDIRGWDFVDNDNDPIDDYGHGTICSGIACAETNNSIGIAGVSWYSKVMPLDTFNTEGESSNDDIAKAIYYAADNGADIISMSWGGYVPSTLIFNALDYASSQGVTLVASAGNDKTFSNRYPASYDNVIAVAATDQNDKRANYGGVYNLSSNYGNWVDVAAPGKEIISTLINNQYALANGTSFACPHVSGLASLILSKYDQCPYPAQMVKSVIRYTTDEIETDEYIGTGRINAYKTLIMMPFAFDLEAVPNWEDVKGAIDIKGTIWGEDLKYFVLDMGIGENPSSWTELLNTSSSQGGVLYSLDTTLLDEGLYSLRLQAVYSYDTFAEHNLIYINNEADGSYDADIFVSTCFDNSTPGWGLTHFDKIQNGINKAENGDHVFVYDGIYSEFIEIADSLNSISLVSQNNRWTIIDGNINISNTKEIGVKGFRIRSLRNVNLVHIVKSSDCVIEDNFFDAYVATQCGVGIRFHSKNCIVHNNRIIRNGYISGFKGSMDGIKLHGSQNSVISNNTISGWRVGIEFYSTIAHGIAQNNMVKDNIIRDNKLGVDFCQARKNKLYGNLIQNNKEEGIMLDISIGNVFCKNIISNNGVWGIEFWDFSLFNRFIANNISDNIAHGVYISGMDRGNFLNLFYYNNFFGNYPGGEHGNVVDGKINLWYKPKGIFRGIGNYWDDYTGIDNDGDGIGDSPCKIPGGRNKDRFPFMEPVDINSLCLPNY